MQRTYRERMADVMIADLVRRQERDLAELRALGITLDTDYAHSRNITGEPSEKNRVYRASDDCWKRGLRTRTVGTATNDGRQTVKVTRNGHSEIVPVSHYRKQRIATKQRAHAIEVAQSHRITCADLAPIGNVE